MINLLPKMYGIVLTNNVLYPELLYEALGCLFYVKDESFLINETTFIPLIYPILDTTYNQKWNYQIKRLICSILGNMINKSCTSRDFFINQFDGFNNLFSRLISYEKDIPEMNHVIEVQRKYIKQVKKGKKRKFNDPTETTIAKNTSDETLTDELDVSLEIPLPDSMKLQRHKLYYIRVLIWTITSFYQWDPVPTFHDHHFIARITSFWDLNDFEIQHDIAWLFSSITNIDEKNIDRVISNQKALNKIHSFLSMKQDLTSKSNYLEILYAILEIYSHLSSGSTDQTNILINHNFFDFSIQLLQEIHSSKVQKEIFFITSNVLMGSPMQREYVMSQEKLFSTILSILLISKSIEVRKEAIWALGGLLIEGIEDRDINQLAEKKFIEGSLTFQDNFRYFILKIIQAIKHLKPETAKGILKVFKASLLL